MALLGVTGASGLIGTHFVRLARDRGYELRLFSRQDAQATALDLGQGQVDPALLEGCEAIIHLAARLPSRNSDLSEARECLDVNALGTLRLMEAMRSAGVTRLIHATAANAYAPWVQFPNEEAALYPLSKALYLGSKVLQEIYAEGWGAPNGLQVTSLRISSPYGASPRSAVGRMAAALLRGEPVQLENGGAFGADFILARDVAEAFLLVEGKMKKGIWNVGSGSRTTILEIATELVALTNADPSLIELQPGGSLERPGYPAIDISKIRSEGFVPTNLENGLKEIVEELGLGG
jgi:UDP-glucose 4-epimerase